MTPEDKNLQLFADYFNLEHLIKKPTCFKGSPSRIDLIIANGKACFKKACILETGRSDSLKLTAVSLKLQIIKGSSKIKVMQKLQSV